MALESKLTNRQTQGIPALQLTWKDVLHVVVVVDQPLSGLNNALEHADGSHTSTHSNDKTRWELSNVIHVLTYVAHVTFEPC